MTREVTPEEVRETFETYLFEYQYRGSKWAFQFRPFLRRTQSPVSG